MDIILTNYQQMIESIQSKLDLINDDKLIKTIKEEITYFICDVLTRIVQLIDSAKVNTIEKINDKIISYDEIDIAAIEEAIGLFDSLKLNKKTYPKPDGQNINAKKQLDVLKKDLKAFKEQGKTNLVFLYGPSVLAIQ